MDKKTQFNIWYAFAAIFLVLLIRDWWVASRTIEPIPYSRFEELLKEGKIEEVYVRQQRLEGKLKEPTEEGRQFFATTRVEPELAERLSRHEVKFTGVIESTFWRDLLSWVLPVLFFFSCELDVMIVGIELPKQVLGEIGGNDTENIVHVTAP